MRKLVTIQRVEALKPIEGADRIELAQVLNWNVVVQKGLYNSEEFTHKDFVYLLMKCLLLMVMLLRQSIIMRPLQLIM